jgi:hypothetical protein
MTWSELDLLKRDHELRTIWLALPSGAYGLIAVSTHFRAFDFSALFVPMTGLALQRPSPMAHTEKALSMPRAASTFALAALRAQFGQTRGDVGLGNSSAMRCHVRAASGL